MPTYATISLPKPKSWDEFEDICHSVSLIKWSGGKFFRYGRQGQMQNGVDILGCGKTTIGVQCKHVQKLTINDVRNEVNKAESFKPELDEFWIATSLDRDASLQSDVATLSIDRANKGKFGVYLIFWGDIEQELSRNPAELERLYPFINSKKNQVISARDKDIKALISVLNYIDFDQFSYYLDGFAKYIEFAFINHYNPVWCVVNQPTFNLRDEKLCLKFRSFMSKWGNLVNKINSAPYKLLHRDTLSFIMDMDFCRNEKEEKQYYEIRDLCIEFLKELPVFCGFIDENYPEIDLAETNQVARNFFNSI